MVLLAVIAIVRQGFIGVDMSNEGDRLEERVVPEIVVMDGTW